MLEPGWQIFVKIVLVKCFQSPVFKLGRLVFKNFVVVAESRRVFLLVNMFTFFRFFIIFRLILFQLKKEVQSIILNFHDFITNRCRLVPHLDPLPDHSEHNHPNVDHKTSIHLFSNRQRVNVPVPNRGHRIRSKDQRCGVYL